MSRNNDNPFASTTTGAYEPPSWLSADGQASAGYSQVQRDDSSHQGAASPQQT